MVDVKLKDKNRGHVWLSIRDGVVVGAMGSEPKRYMGLTLDQAKHLARYGSVARTSGKSQAELDAEINAWARGVSERAASERTARGARQRSGVRPGGKRDV